MRGKRIGGGSSGSVYEAMHIPTGSLRAVKLLNGGGTQDARDRFIREAKAAQRLKHPNICQVYDFGFTENSETPFYSMELLTGSALAELIKNGAMPIEDSVAILTQVLSALQCAHDHNIVHRDAKPGNIFVVGSSNQLMAKLLDFGALKTQDTSAFTSDSIVMGTPYYMAPEQTFGGHIDHRVDIYTAGVVLYECVTGKKPYDGSNQAEIIDAIAKAKPIVLPGGINPLVPRAVEYVIMKAIAHDPRDRFQSAAEMKAALQDVIGKNKNPAPRKEFQKTTTEIRIPNPIPKR